MYKYIYKISLTYIFFIKSLYKKKTVQTSSLSTMLSGALFLLNIHSFLVILEYLKIFNIGLSEFWRPTVVPKSGYGYLIGIILVIIYYFISKFIESHLDKKQKYSIRKKVVSKGRKRALSIVYVVITIIAFFVSIFMTASLTSKY